MWRIEGRKRMKKQEKQWIVVVGNAPYEEVRKALTNTHTAMEVEDLAGLRYISPTPCLNYVRKCKPFDKYWIYNHS